MVESFGSFDEPGLAVGIMDSSLSDGKLRYEDVACPEYPSQ